MRLAAGHYAAILASRSDGIDVEYFAPQFRQAGRASSIFVSAAQQSYYRYSKRILNINYAGGRGGEVAAQYVDRRGDDGISRLRDGNDSMSCRDDALCCDGNMIAHGARY